MTPPETGRLLEAGQSLGRYRLLRRLGAGAMGEVFLAEDPQIGRRLAVKVVRLGQGLSREVEARTTRLQREARAAGKLLHPNVVALFDVGEDAGLLFLAFEYVDGSDLLERLHRSPPLTLGEILRLGREVAQGLAYAHGHGIVHRDVKPSNVMLDRSGQAKIGDFGIARFADQTTELTTAGAVVGSPQYLAPEQIRGEPLDGRSDLFSLGVVLYELLTGRRPFEGEILTTLVYQILHHEPPPVRQLQPGLPPRVEEIVARLMAKDRDARYASAEEVAADLMALEAALPKEMLAAVPTGRAAVAGAAKTGATAPTQLLERKGRRNPWPAVSLAAGVLIVALVVILVSVLQQDRDVAPPELLGGVGGAAPEAEVVLQTGAATDPGDALRGDADPGIGVALQPEDIAPMAVPKETPIAESRSAAPEEAPANEEHAEQLPVVTRLQPLSAEADPQAKVRAVYEVRKGVALEVAPKLARILLDGKMMGAAIEFLGERQGRARGPVPLDAGIHRITVLAPGFIPQEIEVNVHNDAGLEHQAVRIQLARRGGPARRRQRHP